MCLNPKKSSFAFQEIDVLGYRISSNVIQIRSDRTKAIIESKQPTTVRQVKRFCGAISYFRKFIPNVSQRSYHMRRLLKKGVPFHFSKECVDEWNDLKNALVSPDILLPIQENADWYLFCDGSKFGYGHAWFQRCPRTGSLRPVSYGSYSSKDSQRKYSAATCELYSLYLALKSMQNHVINHRIFVYTDSVSVQMLKSLSALTNRDRRMHSYFQNFELHIAYRRASDNKLADYLSRLPESLPDAERVTWEALDEDDLIMSIRKNRACNGSNNRRCQGVHCVDNQ